MLFNSYIFIFLFLPLCLAGFYSLQNRQATLAKVWLTCFSLWFYGYFNQYYLLIMLGSIIGNYFVHCLIVNARNIELCKKRSGQGENILIAGVILNLLVLFYFKYLDFFLENVNNFSLNQLSLYRRVGFPDVEFETLLHKIYPSSMLETYYSITFSFVPYEKDIDIRYDIYSNEKGALPCYLALLYDINTKEVRMCYDCQSKIIKEKDVINFKGNVGMQIKADINKRIEYDATYPRLFYIKNGEVLKTDEVFDESSLINFKNEIANKEKIEVTATNSNFQ